MNIFQKKKLFDSNLNFRFGSETVNDPNIVLEKLITIIQSSYNEVFPIRRVSKRRIKMKHKPWMSHEILSMIKEKHKFFKKYLKNKTPENLSLYKEKRNKIKREVEKAKKQYYHTYFNNCKYDVKKSFLLFSENMARSQYLNKQKC